MSYPAFYYVKCEKHGDEAAEFYGKGIPTLRVCVKEVEEAFRPLFQESLEWA